MVIVKKILHHFKQMIFLTVGDAQTQLEGLEELRLGQPVLLPDLD